MRILDLPYQLTHPLFFHHSTRKSYTKENSNPKQGREATIYHLTWDLYFYSLPSSSRTRTSFTTEHFNISQGRKALDIHHLTWHLHHCSSIAASSPTRKNFTTDNSNTNQGRRLDLSTHLAPLSLFHHSHFSHEEKLSGRLATSYKDKRLRDSLISALIVPETLLRTYHRLIVSIFISS